MNDDDDDDPWAAADMTFEQQREVERLTAGEQQREIDRVMTGREAHWIDGLTFDGIRYTFDGEMDADTFGRACLNLGRNERPALLFDMYHAGALAIDLHPGVVAEVWSTAEFPESCFDIPETWRDMFEDAGYTHNGKPAPRPSAPVTVYRGCTPDRRFGMAWSADLERARWFANRDFLRGAGRVYVHRAFPPSLLAYIGESSRGEAEYVLDPSPDYLNHNTVGLNGIDPTAGSE